MMRSSKIQPLLILGGAFLVVLVLFVARRTPEERPRQDAAPLVRVTTVQATPFQFSVSANGEVSPRTESDLIPQVSGEVVEMSPSLVPGGFFEAGDLLARIDDADYRVDREAARAQVARAKSEHDRAKKELGRQKRLADRSVSSESRIDDAKNDYRIAEASLREAEARLERAERDLDRTTIRAPYRGLVRSEHVDVGQFVTRGTAIATIYAVDFAEVRLPLPDRELAYLDIARARSMDPTADGEPVEGAPVRLRAEFAGESHEWQARLVRTEAELDPRSRMVNLVARVTDPLGLETPRSAPLAIGLFVEATIEGIALESAFVLPRDSLRPGERVYVVDDEDRIRFREVDLLRTERDRIIIGSGLQPGDRVCTSPLDAAIDGMAVRVVDAEPASGLAERVEPDSVPSGTLQ